MKPDLSRSITHHPHLFSPPRVPTISSNYIATSLRASRGRRRAAALEELGGSVARQLPVSAIDLESQAIPGPHGTSFCENDVYNLLSSYKSPSELSRIVADTSRTLGKSEGGTHTPAPRMPFCLPTFKTRRLRRFYERQNETIERMLKSVEEHRADALREAGAEALHLKIAVYGSLVANLVLSALQIFAAVTSGSLSLITTMADAVFDPLSNLILILSNRATHHVNPRRFPAGRARLEPAGNILFCFIMIAVSVLIIAFSIRDLSSRWGEVGVNGFHLSSIVAVITSFTTKLGLFIYCCPLRKRYSQVRIVWQDHRNDLLINGFGILTSVGGSKLIWWIDSLGAIVLSVLFIILWLRTAWTEFLLLVCVAASIESQQLFTFICLCLSPAISGFVTVRVYHSGPRLIAEVDVVMDREAALADIHDTAEALQLKLERLPDIERSYVHVDYETTHKPEHSYEPQS